MPNLEKAAAGAVAVPDLEKAAAGLRRLAGPGILEPAAVPGWEKAAGPHQKTKK